MHDDETLDNFDDLLEHARSLLGAFENDQDLWEANDCINQAIYIRQNEADAWLIKSQVMSALGDDASALAAARLAIACDGDWAESHFVLATVLTDMELYDESLKVIERAFRLNKKNPDHNLLEDLFYEKAAVLDLSGRSEEAVNILEKGLKQFPDSPLLKGGLEPLRLEQRRNMFAIIPGGRK